MPKTVDMLSILRTKLSTYSFLTGKSILGWPKPKDSAGQSPNSPLPAVQRCYTPSILHSMGFICLYQVHMEGPTGLGQVHAAHLPAPPTRPALCLNCGLCKGANS